MVYDGKELLTHESGASEFVATSDPYYDQLGIPCIEVKWSF
jgi:hypothetical protein